MAGTLWAADVKPAPGGVVSVVRADPHTGRLVRSVVVTPRIVVDKPAAAVVGPRVLPSVVPVEPALNEAVEQAAARNALPAALLDSVIRVESNYNPYAISPKGALGLMQLIPATARRFGVNNVFNPVENLEGGARYLRYLLDLYGGNYPLALAAYNAGEQAVAKYGGVPPYRETQNYLQLVKKQLDKGVRPAAPPPAPAAPPGLRASDQGHIEQIEETDGTVRYVSRR